MLFLNILKILRVNKQTMFSMCHWKSWNEKNLEQ